MLRRTVKKHCPLATAHEINKIIELSGLKDTKQLDEWLNDYTYVTVMECYEIYDDLLSTTYNDYVDNFQPYQVIEQLIEEQDIPLHYLSNDAFLMKVRG